VNRVDIDKKYQQKIGPYKTCQTVMIRGLIGNWKQPLYYKFDQPMDKDILMEIISELYEASYSVVALVSDMGTGNVRVWSQFNVGHNKPCFFSHPCNET
jgi:hypothetical protein